MNNADILTDFIKSIQARAGKSDKYAYTTGFLNSFIHMNMSDNPKLVEKMLEYTKANFEAAGRAV